MTRGTRGGRAHPLPVLVNNLTNDIPNTLARATAETTANTRLRRPRSPDADRVALEAATAERARIAGLLHAGVLQELTVAALQLDAFSRTLPPPADAAARDLARSISKQQRAIREILSSSGPDEGEPQ